MAVQAFEWAENNFGVESPQRFQEEGVNVYFAPNIAPETKVVDLANGQVASFWADQDRPQEGYFADWTTLARYCRDRGIPLAETDGLATVQPTSTRQAGDPLRHEGV